jgi:murein DD-endopeptidase MepM/ murein hydrolase activator NlpD
LALDTDSDDDASHGRIRPAARGKRRLIALLALALAAGFAAWAWRQPFLAPLRVGWALSRMAPAERLPVPVDGVAARAIADTFGAPRGRDRKHQGVDIFARRGTAVRSATLGVVAAIRDSGLGGRQVWVMGPARERYYYAHLERWSPRLRVGGIVRPGDAIGEVGDSGNARGTPTHLHFGVYGRNGARDPLPLLRAGAVRRVVADDDAGPRPDVSGKARGRSSNTSRARPAPRAAAVDAIRGTQ